MSKSKLRTIFLIDDDQHHNEMLVNFLENKYRLDIHTFNTGEDALLKMEELKPTFITLDFHLDRLNNKAKNGIEILKMIKTGYPDANVLMLSGQDKIEVAVSTMQNGAYDYVVKNPSGFVRIENVLKNINQNLHLREQSKSYRFATFLLSGVILAIIITAVVFKLLGVYNV